MAELSRPDLNQSGVPEIVLRQRIGHQLVGLAACGKGPIGLAPVGSAWTGTREPRFPAFAYVTHYRQPFRFLRVLLQPLPNSAACGYKYPHSIGNLRATRTMGSPFDPLGILSDLLAIQYFVPSEDTSGRLDDKYSADNRQG